MNDFKLIYKRNGKGTSLYFSINGSTMRIPLSNGAGPLGDLMMEVKDQADTILTEQIEIQEDKLSRLKHRLTSLRSLSDTKVTGTDSDDYVELDYDTYAKITKIR